MDIPFEIFPHYVSRIPLLSFNLYKNLTLKKHISDNDLKQLCNDPVIKEALFLASPPLYEAMNKWLANEMKDNKKEERLKHTILKYVSRMSSRCTPFGLFAGCSIGKFAEETKISLRGVDKNKRHTRLDMNYLVALSQDLAKIDNIRKQLLFFPNSSIYKAGDQLRYVEYRYINSKRHHYIVAVDDTEYLKTILFKANNGSSLMDLAEILVNDEITLAEAIEFIGELIDSQFLVSNLEPSVSGPEFLEQIYSVLEKINGTDTILTLLKKAKDRIKKIDYTIGNTPQKYLDICEDLKKLGTDFDLKSMFQTDMTTGTERNMLDRTLINQLKKGFTLLNKISLPPKTSLLNQFKDEFYKRYEKREVPLSKVLDVEIGVGYGKNKNPRDVSTLVDDILIAPRKPEHNIIDLKWTPVNMLFQKKLIEAFNNNTYTIILTDEDLKDYNASWTDLPDTISFMIEILLIDGKEKIRFVSGGGSSAANLLARFCHGDHDIDKHTREIIDVEASINKDKILAEIVHLPESRVGNILMRPAFRKYEIPYLAKSIMPRKHQLPLGDLMISINQNEEIVLKSKKYDKEVIPRLTNAHNYSHNSLPIYNFLCDMQTKGVRGNIGFHFGPFAEEYEFLPRVVYEDIIIHNATWNLKKKHIENLLKYKNDDIKLDDALLKFRSSLQIPQYVMLVDGDNKLLINLENLTSVRMLLSSIAKRPGFQLIEFLFSENGIVKQANEYYTNQIIVSFYNKEKLDKNNVENSGS